MNSELVYNLGKENCPGLSNGWCHMVGAEPCDGPETCPFIYWFKIIGKANLMEKKAREKNGRDA